ncbi:ephrin-B3-like, partial [Myiozetetes cayanensis]|uniref:ephrin-B3-like n=1 Tax=Myiozetetes cayanensis TaxID=478635 RepID=UPI002160342D
MVGTSYHPNVTPLSPPRFQADGGYVLYPKCHSSVPPRFQAAGGYILSPQCPPQVPGSGGYVLYPQIGDRLDLVCPGGAGYEYYKLYLVGGAQARRCQVPPAPTLLLTCDRPQRDVRFTIKFQEFSPNLWGHEFRRLHDYYIITTSDGTPEGLENRQGGACLTRAMRVTLRVGQRECPSPTPPLPHPDPAPTPLTPPHPQALGGASPGPGWDR